ncbi:unnamed protein product [Amaranthus hypochondriacus]
MSLSYPSGASFDLFDCVWRNKDREEVELFVTFCWQIWKTRNNVIFNSICDLPSLCVRRAVDWLREYKANHY